MCGLNQNYAMKIKGSNLSCAICQPHYLPWIGYFEMIDRVDVFVFLDDVQFVKREWKNRNRIRKTSTGNETKWLTVPVVKQYQHGLIKDAIVSQEFDWRSKHTESLKMVYRNTPYFDVYYPEIKNIIQESSCQTLSELNTSLIEYFCCKFKIDTKLMKSSDLNVNGKREAKLLNLCKEIKSDYYLANNATAEYVSKEYFLNENIEFGIQNYVHPMYEQKSNGELLSFISHLSIVDIVFNQGPESIKIIREGGRQD